MPPRSRKSTLTWEQAAPAPVVLVRGGEGLLADRAIAAIVTQYVAQHPETDVTTVSAIGYGAGQLDQYVSASLFSSRRCVIFTEAEVAGEAFVQDILAYLTAPEQDVVVVVRHAGGQRGKKLLDAIVSAGFPMVTCDGLKRDTDKLAFAAAEFARAGRQVDSRALRALVDAFGGDLAELAAACAQLMADTAGRIGEQQAAVLAGGRVEATGFQVADAATSGQLAQALTLTRHAFDTGVDPVVIVAALASKLRTLSKVAGARRRRLDPVAELGLAPWLVDKARRELSSWDGPRMAAAIEAVAQADTDVKGDSRDPRFAVERAVVLISGLASKS